MTDLRKESPLCQDCSGFFCRNNYDSVLKCLSEGHSQYSPRVIPEEKKEQKTIKGGTPMKLPKWLVTTCCILLIVCVVVLTGAGITQVQINEVIDLVCKAIVAVGAVVAAIRELLKQKKLE